MIQAATDNAAVPGVVVGVGSDVPERTDPERFRRKFGIEPAVRDLHRPHRREQGLPRALLPLPALCGGLPARPRPGADRQRDHRRAETSPDSPPRVPRRPRQVRRAGGVGPADHAVVLREPVDGRPRGVGARPAGAGQRALRRAEGAVHPEQRGALLRELRGVRRGPLLARVERAAERAARPQRPRVLQAELRVAGDRAEVPRHVRSAQADFRLRRDAGSSDRAGSPGGSGNCRRRATILDASVRRGDPRTA